MFAAVVRVVVVLASVFVVGICTCMSVQSLAVPVVIFAVAVFMRMLV